VEAPGQLPSLPPDSLKSGLVSVYVTLYFTVVGRW